MSVIMMLDNSSSSINGDFLPTRLEAQKITVERFAEFHMSSGGQSEIAVGSMANTEFGLRLSFTQSVQKLRDVTGQISPTGKLSLYRGIKTALLAIRHSSCEVKDKTIIVFICSEHDITPETALEIGCLINSQGVSLKMVVFGENIEKEEILARIVKTNPKKIKILRVKKSRTMLSDDVLQDAIDPGRNMICSLTDYAQSDPGLAKALELSKQQHRAPQHNKSSLTMLLTDSQNQNTGKQRKRSQPCVKRRRKSPDPE